MEIEPISRVGGAASPMFLPAVHNPPQTSAAQTALGDARLIESETLEQRASDGDLMAIEELANDEKNSTPIDSEQVLPSHSQSSSPAHEAGKGDIIDIYD
jgi:hypothetical protein